MKYPNLFLIGFMGSGKSHWGQIWAEKYQLSFIDLDEQIEKDAGMTVEEIFEKQGEEAFRNMEKSRLQKIRKNRNLLVACGGGTPCFSDNMDWMLKHGVVIYLKASVKYILRRVMDETDKRPLLKKVNESELIFFIEKTLQGREPVYNRANYILDAETCGQDSLQKIMDEIVASHDRDAQKQSGKPILKH